MLDIFVKCYEHSRGYHPLQENTFHVLEPSGNVTVSLCSVGLRFTDERSEI
jgi:hypothetical protein